MKSNKRKNAVFDVAVVLIIIVLLAIEIFRPGFTGDEELDRMISIIISRLLGFAVFLPISINSRYRIFGFTSKRPISALLCCIPALMVCVNNIPIVGLISGTIVPNKPAWFIALFSVQCLSIGLFEEFAFRAVLLPAVLHKYGYSKKSIFLSVAASSAAFGMIHLFNILEGAGIGPVVLQIGYSALIGGMCAIVLLRTRCIWLCVILHTVFDFGGFFVPSVAIGKLWDTPTVVITAILGVITAVFMIHLLLCSKPSEVDSLFPGLRIRKSDHTDISEMLRIYSKARIKMASDGNPHQWGDRSYPPAEILEDDVICGTGRLLISDGLPVAAFAFVFGPDPTYGKIDEGNWKKDLPYASIHRIASDGTMNGVFDVILDYCSSQTRELRIDTHKDNKRMKHILEKNGFSRCGIIYADDGTPRIAFSLSID